jgi:hypothetical protein
VDEEVEKLKQRLPLLDYLRRQNWTAQPAGHGSEFVGLCPLHPETRPSFYVNTISFTVTAAARAAISFALSSCPAICPSAKASRKSFNVRRRRVCNLDLSHKSISNRQLGR